VIPQQETIQSGQAGGIHYAHREDKVGDMTTVERIMEDGR
jgi:hypothetical protein